MARLKSLIYPGETILLRERRAAGEIMARMIAPFLAVGGVFAAIVYGTDYINDWLGSLSGGIAILMLLLLMTGVELPFISALANLRADHWRVAVTDQRVLVRRGLLGRGHDEMMRYDIETCLYDRAEGKVVLAGAGRELAIACSQRQAGRILAALGYEEAGA